MSDATDPATDPGTDGATAGTGPTTDGTDATVTMRALDTADADELAGLADLFSELQTVLHCCEAAVTALTAHTANGEGGPAGAGDDPDVVAEALWTTAVLAYTRCFATDRAVRLTGDDVAGLPLEGEVTRWHEVLLRLRDHYAAPADNPRERFSVNAVTGTDDSVSGIAVTSTPLAPLDEVTVRQTGALAYQLAQLVEGRLGEKHPEVRTAAAALPREHLRSLPEVEVSTGG
ncbi:hypothetical protein [Saccharomonospora halophila]|uniref:hypothetical protein n=1 Tax=Saccharomonospora halophila TaxID=129922 RepID=UPI000372306D|nr:hypothetical protein [Saccharomonospora halophila]